MPLTYAEMVSIGDKLVAAMLTCVPQQGTTTSSTTPGFGDSSIAKGDSLDYGMLRKLRDLQDVILTGSPADADVVNLLLPAVKNAPNVVPLQKQIAATLGAVLAAVEAACVQSGQANAISAINSLETFLQYYNTGAGGYWNCLMPPDWRTLYYNIRNAYPAAYNLYFEVLQGAAYTNALGKLIASGPTFTDGVAIDSTKYAGGVAQVTTSGFAGAADTVTVNGTWRKQDGTTGTGNGTVTVSGNGTVAVSGLPFANALLLDVAGITAGPLITGGTIYAEAKRPSGRTYPPT